MSATLDLTVLLDRYQQGDGQALNDLVKAVYPELKAMARRRSSAYPMSATTLVQEAFARFMAIQVVQAHDRKQFFALAATIMRRVLVDEVRSTMSAKRSAAITSAQVEELEDREQVDDSFLLAVDEALGALGERDPLLVQVFECRYFAGYTVRETASIMNLAPRTTDRLWQEARERMAQLLKE